MTGKKIFSNSYLLSGAKKLITILCSVLITSLISRYLGPERKGDYSYFVSLMNIFVIFAEFGYFKLYARDKRENAPGLGDRYFSLFVSKTLILLVLGAAATLIMWKCGLPHYLLLLPLMIVLSSFSAELVFLLLIDRFGLNILISSVAPILNAALLVLAYLFTEASVVTVILIYGIKEILIILLCILLGKYRLVFSRAVFDIAWDNRRVVLYPVVASLLVDFNYKLDVIFLKNMSESYTVGLYASAVSLSEIAWMIPDVFKEVLFNKTARSDSIDSINASLRFSNLIILLFMAFLAVFGKLVIRLLMGADYVGAYGMTMVLLFGLHSMAVFKILNPLYQARGQWRFYTLTLLLSVIANMVLNALLIPSLAGYGAALASVVSYAICGGVLLLRYGKDFQIPTRDILFPKKEDWQMLLSFLKR